MNKVITNLTVTDDVSLITIQNMPGKIDTMSKILVAIANSAINVDMITQTPLAKSDIVSFSFTISSTDIGSAINILGCFKQEYPRLVTEINSNNTKICVYGENMPNHYGVAAEMFLILSQNNIDVKLVTTSEIDISILIGDGDADKAANLLAQHYEL